MNLILLLLIQAPVDSVDILLRNGTVYDGTGAAARRLDLGIRGERILLAVKRSAPGPIRL